MRKLRALYMAFFHRAVFAFSRNLHLIPDRAELFLILAESVIKLPAVSVFQSCHEIRIPQRQSEFRRLFDLLCQIFQPFFLKGASLEGRFFFLYRELVSRRHPGSVMHREGPFFHDILLHIDHDKVIRHGIAVNIIPVTEVCFLGFLYITSENLLRELLRIRTFIQILFEVGLQGSAAGSRTEELQIRLVIR